MHKSVTEKLIAETESYPNLSSEIWVFWELISVRGHWWCWMLVVMMVVVPCSSSSSSFVSLFLPSSVASE
jgi:hypothetical protein